MPMTDEDRLSRAEQMINFAMRGNSSTPTVQSGERDPVGDLCEGLSMVLAVSVRSQRRLRNVTRWNVILSCAVGGLLAAFGLQTVLLLWLEWPAR